MITVIYTFYCIKFSCNSSIILPTFQIRNANVNGRLGTVSTMKSLSMTDCMCPFLSFFLPFAFAMQFASVKWYGSSFLNQVTNMKGFLFTAHGFLPFPIHW